MERMKRRTITRITPADAREIYCATGKRHRPASDTKMQQIIENMQRGAWRSGEEGGAVRLDLCAGGFWDGSHRLSAIILLDRAERLLVEYMNDPEPILVSCDRPHREPNVAERLALESGALSADELYRCVRDLPETKQPRGRARFAYPELVPGLLARR